MYYDVSKAFKRIENELIDSMMRNLSRHRAEELAEGYNWAQWQVVQLAELEKYRKTNPAIFAGDFSEISNKIVDAYLDTYEAGKDVAEDKILERLLTGTPEDANGAIEGAFFGLNEGRFAHMVEATKADFARGEWSMLRQANDQYRKTIFDAQMYAATGATYEQAVDMATKDFLKNGIQCITYKNGAKHTMQDYASMALRTGQKRAYLMGEGDVADKYGIHTVRVNKRLAACPQCIGWLGKVLVDDVYAGGTAKEAIEEGVPLLSEAIAEGFLHPNCKDVYSLYIKGVSKPAEPWTKEELQKIADDYNEEQAIKRADDMVESYDRMAKYSLDPVNKARYQARADEWQERAKTLKSVKPTPSPFTSGQLANIIQQFSDAEPTPEPYKQLTTTVNGNTYKTAGKQLSSKPWANKVSPGDIPFEKKLTPSLADYQAHIKDLKKAKVDDNVLKPILEKASAIADDEIAALKAAGATKQKIGGISTKKAFIDKDIKIIDQKATVKDLEAVLQDAKDYKAANMPADASFSGIWQQDVKLSEFTTYEPKWQNKAIYYYDKIDEWQTKGVAQYGKTQAEVDAKVAELTKHLDDLNEYKQKGEAYKQAVASLDDAVKVAQDNIDAAKDELFKLEHPKQWAKQNKGGGGGKYTFNPTPAEMKNADFIYDIREADREYRGITSNAWLNSTKSARRSGYDYTLGSGAHNRPLRGYDDFWSPRNFKGVGNIPLTNEGRTNVLDLADMIDKAEVPEGKWFARGLGDSGAMTYADSFAGYVGEDVDFIENASIDEIRAKLIGKRVVDEGYQSHGVVKSAGGGGHEFETYAPKGTRALYVEPFSHFGRGGGLTWDGISGQTSFHESEILFQTGTTYEIMDVEYLGGTGYNRRFRVVQKVVAQRSPEEIRGIWAERMKKIGAKVPAP